LIKNQNDIAKASKNNPKAFWKYVKTKTKGKEPVGELRYIDQYGSEALASTDDCKADVLCDFFLVFLINRQKVTL